MLFLLPFSRLDKLIISRAMFILYLYFLMRASIKSFHLQILVLFSSCTNSMSPHSNYLGKGASVASHQHQDPGYYVVVRFKMGNGALCSGIFDEFRNLKLFWY